MTVPSGRFEHPKCTGDFPEADLPDLLLLGEAGGTTSPEAPQLVLDIATLPVPLSAVRTVAPF